MRNNLMASLFACVLLMASSVGHAGWWIFGQSEQDVTTSYLTLNNVSYAELDRSVTLFTSAMPGGEVVLRGRGATGKRSRIGSVQVSRNDGQTWEAAKLARNGSFEFRFAPTKDEKIVLLVKITDTAGKTNEVDETRRELVFSDQDMNTVISEVMDQLVRAYEEENAAAFMRLVSTNFAGDSRVLDSAVRRDFSLFDNIDLGYSLNNVTATAGRVFVSFNYRRHLESSRYGTNLSDTGMTEFVFVQEGGRHVLYSLKKPVIFGLSEADAVATGIVNSPANGAVIGLVANGDIVLHPVADEPGASTPAPTNLRNEPGSTYPMNVLLFTVAEPLSASTHEVLMQANLVGCGVGDPDAWTDVDASDPGYGYLTDFAQSKIVFVHGQCNGAKYRIAIRNKVTGDESNWSNEVFGNGP